VGLSLNFTHSLYISTSLSCYKNKIIVSLKTKKYLPYQKYIITSMVNVGNFTLFNTVLMISISRLDLNQQLFPFSAFSISLKKYSITNQFVIGFK
jgi:hypothetical protein